jgi:hypothetical protein
LFLGEGSLVSSSLNIEKSVLGSEVNFEDSEFSGNGNLVKSFFSWLIFINNVDGFKNIQLMKAEDLVSQDFGDLASGLGSVSGGLEDDEFLLLGLIVTQKEGGSIRDVSADSWNSSNSDFILGSFLLSLLDLDVFISGSGV